MKLLAQEYLRSGRTLDQLKEEHGVKYSITNGKVCLNYDQIQAKESDPVACQCRGLVLENETWNTIAVPFFRFFNFGQEQAANIDWDSADYENKLDGSCIIVYHYKDKWYCGTRGRCEADADAHGSQRTFAELVEEICKRIHMVEGISVNLQDLMALADKSCTYIFELTTPLNRVVCRYENWALTLLGVRNIHSLIEEHPKDHLKYFADFDIKSPDLYSFSSIQDMVEVIKTWNPEFYEGIVAKDSNFNRVKVKNPSYVAYNHARDSLATSFRGCVEVVLLKKEDDIIHMMPDEIANRIRMIKCAVSKLFAQFESDYNRLKDIQDMKEFALQAKDCIWPGPMFAIKRGKAKNLEEFLFRKQTGTGVQTSTIDSVLELCKKVDPSLKDVV